MKNTTATPDLQRILSNIADIPIGKTIRLEDRAKDGFGGMIVKRSRRSTWVFQREFCNIRSRWADSLSDCLMEIDAYLGTGKLHEPDSVAGF